MKKVSLLTQTNLGWLNCGFLFFELKESFSLLLLVPAADVAVCVELALDQGHVVIFTRCYFL